MRSGWQLHANCLKRDPVAACLEPRHSPKARYTPAFFLRPSLLSPPECVLIRFAAIPASIPGPNLF